MGGSSAKVKPAFHNQKRRIHSLAFDYAKFYGIIIKFSLERGELAELAEGTRLLSV